MKKQIPISQPSLTDHERRELLAAFDSGWISGVASSPYVQKFEAALSKRINRKYVLAVSNGTVALEVALRALGVGPHDDVIVPAFTFISPAAVVRQIGARPIFVDVDPVSWTLDPQEVKRKLTPKVKAVVAVDTIGHPADYDALKFLEAYRVLLVEDAAEAHGAQYRKRLTGSFGAVSTFSMFVNKGVTAGEGGAVLTHHDQLAAHMRMMINHGMPAGKGYYHEIVGMNGRMNSLSAAIGAAQMDRWDELLKKREQVGRWYDELLPDGVGKRPVAPWAKPITWLYTILTRERDRLQAALAEAGVETRPVFTTIPLLPIYADGSVYPNSELISKTGLFLPTYADLSREDVEYICDVLRKAI